MLLRFGVENHYSIREYQEVSLIASSLKEHKEALISAPPEARLPYGVLPVLALYGANGSGKSNAILGFRYLRAAVLNSFEQGKPNEEIATHPFLLDDESKDKPSKFDCDFLVGGVRYHYGFSLDKQLVREEWLYAYPKGSRQIWFHRNADEQPAFFFGKELKGQNRTVQELTRPNALFLSAAAQANHSQLTPLYEYFRDGFILRLSVDSANERAVGAYFKDAKNAARIAKFMSTIDSGISTIIAKEEPLPEEVGAEFAELTSVLQKFIGDKIKLSDVKNVTVQLGHLAKDGKVRNLSFGVESAGTRYLLAMLGPVFSALDSGKTIILDEITTSLHTLLSRQLISLFHSKSTNAQGAQLLFSTHDTNLLCMDVLRRDEVWFVEKDDVGQSVIYPLTDIATKNTDNLEKGYVQGRFGAIPLIGDISSLFTSHG